jgi:histone acetyltransferase (RNA polymerase elongator complex component)
VKIYPVFIPHAGCPHRCLFCAQERTTTQPSPPEASEVEIWLEASLPQRGGGEIAFYGGTFTQLPIVQQSRYLAMAGRFAAAGRVTGIRVSTRPDALEDECIARLQAAGVTTVEIGCQSFNPTVLTSSGRGHAVDDCASAIRRCRHAGLQVGVQLMPGLPGGDAAEALLSLRRALELKPAFVRIYPTVVIDGTALAELWKTGGFSPWTLEEAVEVCADMLHLCRLADVPVIRIGLQTDAQLEANLLAGPYHPAFGQLVRSRLWRRALLRAGSRGRSISINPDDLSDALGHRAENRDWLAKHGSAVCLTTDKTIARGLLRISGQDFTLDALPPQGGQYG